jgi:hypothetical protein
MALAAKGFIRLAPMLPQSALMSHVKTAERILKTANGSGVIACCRQNA